MMSRTDKNVLKHWQVEIRIWKKEDPPDFFTKIKNVLGFFIKL
jgi:hypothetical protein